MKKLFIAVPLICAMFFNSSCKKDVETETIYITDTLTVLQNNSVAITMDPFDQTYYSSLGYYSMVSQNFSVTNIGDKKIDYLTVTFEAITKDGAKYNGSGYIQDIGINETISGSTYITVGDKECASIKVKSVEITIY